MRTRLAIALLCLWTLTVPALAETPICQPSRPLPRAELYPEDDHEMKMSIRKLEKRAAKNDVGALNALGVMYGTGMNVELDSRKSFEYYRRAAELGMPTGQINLGYMYLEGEGTEQNEAEAWRLFRLAAEVGHMRAQQFLGYMLGEGIYVEQNLTEAAYCYLLAARQGSTEAQHTMATIYQQGLGVPASHRDGLIWRERAREATRTRKMWFDETPLAGIPEEWNPPYEFVAELDADALVRTAHYSFKVRPPTAALKSQKWEQFAGKPESRNTGMWIGLQGYDTYGVLVEARGKLAEGENILAAARRIRPALKFEAVPGRECASMDAAPFRTADLALLVGFCVRPSDQEVFEIGVSRKSLTFLAKDALDATDIADLAGEMQLVFDSFRFE